MTSLVSRSLLIGPDVVSTLAFSNNLLASGFENGSVSLWAPNETQTPLFLFNSSLPCSAITFSENSTVLYAAHGGKITSWDLRRVSNPTHTWEVSDDEINCIDLLESEQCLAVADDDGFIKLVSTSSGETFQTLQKHENICSAVKFRSNRPDQLISAGLDCRLFVSDWKNSGATLTVFEMGDLVDAFAYMNALNLSSDSDPIKGDNDYDNSSNSEVDTPVAEPDNNSLCEPQPILASNTNQETLDEECFKKCVNQDSDRASIRVASSFTSHERREMAITHAACADLPLNPPMIHCMVHSFPSLPVNDVSEYVAVGLESGTIEVFDARGKHLKHIESLFGHRRGVAALLPLGNAHLVSGGNDCNVFVWERASGGSGHQISHSKKICALAGESAYTIYLADSSPVIRVVDLSRS